MGRSGSSSKRKLSKKKRDKVSSQKKGGRKESKRRRRTYDSDDDSIKSEHTSSSTSKSDHRRRINKNKMHRRDYSESSYSDDTDSDSLSTYDRGYKCRKSRRSQVNLKSRKRRAQKRSAKPKSDVDAHNVRKRKRSDRDRVVRRRKKSSKKSRKHFSNSSGSDSESCSTCQSRSSSSTSDGKHRRSKVILDNKIERFRDRESYKTRKKHEERFPSCSSCHRDSNDSLRVDRIIEALSPVNNSRRLKSVITVVNQPHDEEENRYEKDPNKEELVYDQDEYPSPKSVDSNEGSKIELDYHSHHASNKMICVENVAGEEVTEVGKSGINEGDKKNAGDHQSDEANMNNFEKEKEIDVPVPAADDLESILRQKALENLKKFRGGLQSGPRSTILEKNNKSDVNRSSAGQVDDVQNKSTNHGSFNDQEMNQRNGNSLKRDSSPLKVVKQLPVNETVAHSPDGAAVLGCSKEDKGTSSHAVLAETVSRSDTSPGVGATLACSSSTAEPASSVGPISVEHISEQQNEAKDGSQFEQKTMSVMRGGEMVQVSYKVYIPKKVPALARRQLKR